MFYKISKFFSKVLNMNNLIECWISTGNHNSIH